MIRRLYLVVILRSVRCADSLYLADGSITFANSSSSCYLRAGITFPVTLDRMWLRPRVHLPAYLDDAPARIVLRN